MKLATVTFKKDSTWNQQLGPNQLCHFTEWFGSGHLHRSALEFLISKGCVCQPWPVLCPFVLSCISDLPLLCFILKEFTLQVADS